LFRPRLAIVRRFRKTSICPSVCLPVDVEQLDSCWTDFDENWYLSFSKICGENSSSTKIQQEWWVFYIKTFSHLWQYLAKFFLEWEMFGRKFVEKIKIHIRCPVTFLLKSCCVWDNVEKYGGRRGRKWQYGGALHAGFFKLKVHNHTPAPVLPHPDTHAQTLAHILANTNTYTENYVVDIPFQRRQLIRTSLHLL
jgi:hypothetical protein